MWILHCIKIMYLILRQVNYKVGQKISTIKSSDDNLLFSNQHRLITTFVVVA